MDLEILRLREVPQRQKYDITYMWYLKKKKKATNELTYTTEMVANVENKLTVGRG